MSRSLNHWLPAGFLALLLARSFYETSGLLLAAAITPALLYSLLVVRLDRRAHEPVSVVLTVVLLGAVVSGVVVVQLNDMLMEWILSPRDEYLASIFGGALIEETAKAAALGLIYRWRRQTFADALDGVVLGALIGIGFAMSENLQYFLLAMVQAGPPGLLRSIYTRAVVGGFNHAAFAACSGAGWGFYRQGGPWTVVALGWLAAVVQHILWNGIAANRIEQLLCGTIGESGMCDMAPSSFSLFVLIPMVVLGIIGPCVIALIVVARRTAKHPPS